ncbi:MAG TPA: hypothetical protein VNJ52_01250, partial [Patescibacteria group bacterium]|nr:hypothetical protein [Patescibacteria group bacterium]
RCHTLGFSVPLIEEENHQAQSEQSIGIENLSRCGLLTGCGIGLLNYLDRGGHGGLSKGRLP